MKYMLMMNAPRGNGDWDVAKWSQDEVKAMVSFMKRLNEELHEAGELVGAEGLDAPGQAKLVRAGKDGTPITDGVFPEAKEFLAGYWIVDVDTPERAYTIAARASAAPGRGGKPLNMPIEVRQVMSAPPVDVP
jgi:hypothetical protein